jgi:Fe-Mn family superoxide dismutase
MAFTLPSLPYATNALEPHIDTMTMEIHQGRHHKAYVDNLNKALEGQAALASKSIEQLLREINQVPEAIRQAVINNGGGHANHSMFWEIMAPGAGGDPTGPLADDIKASFTDFAGFKAQIKDAGVKRFGSGWAWLVLADGKLKILSTANQDSPYMTGQAPIMGVDVWEHAYYLKYQNKRPDYLDAWWNVVNWKAVGERYAKAKAGKL